MGQSTFTADGTAPFVFDDNWDNFGNLRAEARRLSATNADGVPVVPLTEEQKFTVPPRVRRSGQHRSGHAQPVRTGPGLTR